MPEPGRDETVRVVALDKNFHMKCYKCEVSCPFCLAEVTLSPGKTYRLPNGRDEWWVCLFLCVCSRVCSRFGVSKVMEVRSTK